jgi:hypothetical protein
VGITVTASTASVQPGGTVLFRISAYSNLSADTTGKITSTVTPSEKTPAFAAPVFTVDTCTSTSGTTCTLSVPTAKPSQAQVETQITVPKTATAGETVKYSATVDVTETGGALLTATATAPTITVAKATPTPTPTPTKSSSSTAPAGSGSAGDGSAGDGSVGDGSAGANLDIPGLSGLSGITDNAGALPIGALPAVDGVSTTVPAGNAASLFPQISPSASPSPAPGTAVAVPDQSQAQAEPVADTSRIPLSLGSSEFGAQIIGLIVLLLGVAIAVTRLSVRKTRPHNNK